MIIIGTDSHKRTHTVVAVDPVGRKLAEKTVATNSDGHLALLSWSAQFGQVTFAVEDCRHLTRRLEGDLLRAGARARSRPMTRLDRRSAYSRTTTALGAASREPVSRLFLLQVGAGESAADEEHP